MINPPLNCFALAARKGVAAVVVVCACLALAPAVHADTLVIGAPATGTNAFPFGGPFGTNPGTRYQQVYNAALFPSGPITITEITFFHTLDTTGTINPATYEFHLSTTPRLVNGLDTVNFNANVGADDQLFTVANLSGPVGATLAIPGDPFIYDPSEGNLLLDIRVSGGSPGLTIFFDARNGDFGVDSSRAHNFGTQFDSTGLVTQFTFTQGVIPEPASLTLVGIGIAGLSTYAWRRRRQAT